VITKATATLIVLALARNTDRIVSIYVSMPKVAKASTIQVAVAGVIMGVIHRYRKAKIDCLSLFMCPLLAQLEIGFFSSFSAAAVYSTNKQTRQALSSL
jgi:hypothetical protein